MDIPEKSSACDQCLRPMLRPVLATLGKKKKIARIIKGAAHKPAKDEDGGNASSIVVGKTLCKKAAAAVKLPASVPFSRVIASVFGFRCTDFAQFTVTNNTVCNVEPHSVTLSIVRDWLIHCKQVAMFGTPRPFPPPRPLLMTCNIHSRYTHHEIAPSPRGKRLPNPNSYFRLFLSTNIAIHYWRKLPLFLCLFLLECFLLPLPHSVSGDRNRLYNLDQKKRKIGAGVTICTPEQEGNKEGGVESHDVSVTNKN
jgi:hypothetical protein